jgi:hypothetical protein
MHKESRKDDEFTIEEPHDSDVAEDLDQQDTEETSIEEHDDPEDDSTNIGELNDTDEPLPEDHQSDKVQDSESSAGHSSVSTTNKTNNPVHFKDKVKMLAKKWWNNKKYRYGTFAGMAVLLVILATIPASRYFMMNSIGTRAKASVVVYDEESNNPLKNVNVTIGTQTVVTDAEGRASLDKLKLGRHQYRIQKRAYAERDTKITIGWGSNPLGNINIKPIGAQYSFVIKDWLSGKAVGKAEASAGDFDAIADESGKLTLVVDASSDENLEVTIKAPGYRDEKRKAVQSDSASVAIAMVSDRKQPFITKRSGKYDLYKIDVDGKNEKLVLAGTGIEKDDIGIFSHPTQEIAALISTRDNVRNRDGYLLATLTLVDLKDNSTETIAQSEQFQVLGWSGDSMVYVQIASGASAGNPKRQRLIAYDYKKDENTELASSNSFNDVLLVGNSVYYTQMNNYQPSSSSVGLYRYTIDSKNRTTLLEREAWNIFRTSYDKLDVSAGDEWYQYKIGDTRAFRQSNQPANLKSRQYVDNPKSEKSIWVDERDGKGALILYDVVSGKDSLLKQQSGISNPVRWLNKNTLVYRVTTPQEIADYVINIDGGESKKIRDVTGTYSVGRWYH